MGFKGGSEVEEGGVFLRVACKCSIPFVTVSRLSNEIDVSHYIRSQQYDGETPIRTSFGIFCATAVSHAEDDASKGGKHPSCLAACLLFVSTPFIHVRKR